MTDRGPRELCVLLNKVKPYFAMVSLQFGYAGMNIICMLGMKRGMSHYILVVYRHAIAALVISPFALVFGRVEKLKIKKLHGQAKVVGTLVSLAGATIMTLYKGPIIDLVWARGQSHHETSSGATDQHWVRGTLMILASCFSWSGFFILQSFTLKAYPAELSLTSLICLMGMLEGAAVALVMERDPNAWSLDWDSRLLAPVYSGLVNSGIAYYVQGVVIKERGPIFVTAFSPLCMIIVAALGSLILAEQIHLGSVIGAIIVVVGLYSVMWGTRKDNVSSSPLKNEKGQALELPIDSTP